MRRGLAAALALAAAVLAAGAQPERALACSCAGVDLRAELVRADGAFVGTLLSRRVERRSAAVPASDWPAYSTFRVETTIKGALRSPLVVASDAGSESCGLSAATGQRLGLLLQRSGGRWRSNLCLQAEPQRLLAVAGGLDLVGSREEQNDHFPALNAGGVALGALVLALAGVGLALRLRGRRGAAGG